MGKKNKSSTLGRSLIRDRFANRNKRSNDSMLHTSELDDGYDWGRLNLQSVTEESSFDDFLRTAELAGTEFQAEKLNISFINNQNIPGVLTSDERLDFEKTKRDKKDLIRIPRRPKWDNEMSSEALQAAERESFLEWRRNLAMLQEEEGLTLTPYEKNLDFWRQLWRVVERSDIIVQILDARNPLLFRCEDLEKYSKEIGKEKLNFLLLNKSDFLTEKQRIAWAKYFDSIRIRCAFFSALQQSKEDGEVVDGEKKTTEETSAEVEKTQAEETSAEVEKTQAEETSAEVEKTLDEGPSAEVEKTQAEETSDEVKKTLAEGPSSSEDNESSQAEAWENSSRLLSCRELIGLFERLLPRKHKRQTDGYTTVGLVGYPNVGKSSTINTLLGEKKVSVSATPGKTKHFQTLFVRDSRVMLCDCPGLVMPSMVATKADMLLSGILPIDQMRDFTGPVATLRSLVPDHVLESLYGIMVPPPPPDTNPHSPYPLLNSLAYCRGFMTQNGQPDCSRASRLILKDFVSGRVVYCCAPPSGPPQVEYHPWPPSTKPPPQLTPLAARTIADVKTLSVSELDKTFFNKMSIGAHVKGTTEAGKLKQDQAQSVSDTKGGAEGCEKRREWCIDAMMLKEMRMKIIMTLVDSVKKFRGDKDTVDLFIERVDGINKMIESYKLDHLTERSMLSYLMSRVDRGVLRSLGLDRSEDWGTVRQALRRRYSARGRPPAEILLDLVRLERGRGESVLHYATRFLRLFWALTAEVEERFTNREEVDIRKRMYQEVAVELLSEHLDEYTAVLVRHRKPESVEQLMDILREFLDDSEGDRYAASSPERYVERRPHRARLQYESQGSRRWASPDVTESRYSDSHAERYPMVPRRDPPRGHYRLKPPLQCWECGEEGHRARHCPNIFHRSRQYDQPVEIREMRYSVTTAQGGSLRRRKNQRP